MIEGFNTLNLSQSQFKNKVATTILPSDSRINKLGLEYFESFKEQDSTIYGAGKSNDKKGSYLANTAMELSHSVMNRFHTNEEAYVALKMIEQIKNDLELLYLDGEIDQAQYDKNRELINLSSSMIVNLQPIDSEINKAISNELIQIEFDEFKKLRARPEVRRKFEAVQKLRMEKLSNPELRREKQHLLARKIAKSQFAYSIGVKPTFTPKGVHGAMFMQSVSGKKQGVFKLPDAEVSYFRKVKNSFGLSQKSLLNGGTYSDVCAEKAGYLIAEKIGCPFLTPVPATITSFEKDNEKTGEGAFLVFCKNAKLAAEKKELFDAKKEYSKNELNQFQMFAVFDFLIGNLDRHMENWMVKVRKDGSIKKIIPIDNANILPKQKPGVLNVDGWISLYAWRSLNIAKTPFTDDVKEYVKKLDDRFVDEICDRIDSDEDINTLYQKGTSSDKAQLQSTKFLSEGSRLEMKNRVAILRQILDGTVESPEKLAQAAGLPSTQTAVTWGNWISSWFW